MTIVLGKKICLAVATPILPSGNLAMMSTPAINTSRNTACQFEQHLTVQKTMTKVAKQHSPQKSI